MTRASLLGLVALLGLAAADASADSVRRRVPDSVMLIRGGCMGPCPEYEVTVADTGRVRWVGLDFVDFIGETEYLASSVRARRIVRRAARFDCDAIRRADRRLCTTDMRKAYVVFDDTGTKRALYDDHGCSSPAHRRARRLERAIDRVAKTRQFQPRGRPPCVHEYDNIHYQGPDDVAVRATAVDQPYAIHRGEVLDANLVSLRANPTFRVEVWSMGRPSPTRAAANRGLRGRARRSRNRARTRRYCDAARQRRQQAGDDGDDGDGVRPGRWRCATRRRRARARARRARTVRRATPHRNATTTTSTKCSMRSSTMSSCGASIAPSSTARAARSDCASR